MSTIKLGDLSPTRDLLYVKDTVAGFIEIAKSDLLVGQDCNISTNSEISIKNLAELIINEINPSAKIIVDKERLRPKNSEVYRLFGCNKKILENTNWKINYSFKSAIKETIEWFRVKDNLSRYKHNIYNI